MEIVKKSSKKFKKTKLISDVFNSILGEMALEKFFDKIEISIEEKDDSNINNRNAKISLDYRNPFIQNSDRRAIKILILHQIFHAITRQYVKPMPHVVEDVIINKELIKRGYGDDLLYFYYIYLVNHHKGVNNIEDFLHINVPWISFFSLDDYNSAFLKRIINKFENTKKFQKQSKKLVSVMKKDLLKEGNQKIAINAYKNILAECSKCK